MSEILGKRLKYTREKKGLAQKFVAERIGIKNNTLSGYESGRREPDSDTLRKLAQFYEVTTDYLIGVSNNYYDESSSYKPDYVDEQPGTYNPLNTIRNYLKDKGEQLDQFGFFNINEWEDLSAEEVEEILEDFEMMFERAKKRKRKDI
jgi:HTH-type transcriptional regulator, competence development regulator